MSDQLIEKVRMALDKSGYPLEFETGAILEKQGWTAFHSVEYLDPETSTIRELDVLAYKIINNRRVELRISCKSSTNKQWVFFTKRKSLVHPSDLKITPILADHKKRWKIPKILKDLRFFSEPNEAMNYTVLSGSNLDREGRTLLREAILSSMSSIYLGPIPGGLLFDVRGTIYFFLVILRGNMYEATWNTNINKLNVQECTYAQWSGLYKITDKYNDAKIQNHQGKPVHFINALQWFDSRFRVEIISDTILESYLIHIEKVFTKLDELSIILFGKDWTQQNFPYALLSQWPSIEPIETERNDNPM